MKQRAILGQVPFTRPIGSGSPASPASSGSSGSRVVAALLSWRVSAAAWTGRPRRQRPGPVSACVRSTGTGLLLLGIFCAGASAATEPRCPATRCGWSSRSHGATSACRTCRGSTRTPPPLPGAGRRSYTLLSIMAPNKTPSRFTKPGAFIVPLEEDGPRVLPARVCLDARTAALHEAGHALIYETFRKEADRPPWEYVRIFRIKDSACFGGGTNSQNILSEQEGAIQNMAGLAAEALLYKLPVSDHALASAIVDEWLKDDGSKDGENAARDISDKIGATYSDDWLCDETIRELLIGATVEAFIHLRARTERWEQIANALLDLERSGMALQEVLIVWSDMVPQPNGPTSPPAPPP